MARNQYVKLLAVLLGLLGTLLLGPAIAEAEEAPLRLVYLNTGDSGANASYRGIREVLDSSAQIDLLASEPFLAEAEKLGLRIENFKQGELRQRSIDDFADAMRAAEVEGLLIHDVFARGTVLQVVVIGPMGWELIDLRREIQRGRVSDEQILDVLREVFTVLVPEVRGFRRDQESRAVQEERSESPVEVPTRVVADPRQEAIAAHRERRGYFERGFALRGGGFFGHRGMRLQEEGGPFEINHITALYGAALYMDAIIATFENDTSALELTGSFGFAPFQTNFGTETLGGQYLSGHGDLRYAHLFSRLFRGHLLGGVDLLNISIGSNPQYTGHGYFSGRVGVGMEYRFGRVMSLVLDGLFLPHIATSNSGGAYGETPSLFGYGADGRIEVRHFAPILVGVAYRFRYFEMEYPSPTVLTNGASSRDMVHQAQLLIGYQF